MDVHCILPDVGGGFISRKVREVREEFSSRRDAEETEAFFILPRGREGRIICLRTQFMTLL